MVAAAGYTVRVFAGSCDNIKVTTPGDLVIVERLLAAGRRLAAKVAFLCRWLGRRTVSPGKPFRLAPEHLCWESSGFQAAGGRIWAGGGAQGVPRRAMAFSCITSFRITAVRATLLGLPRARNPQ